MLVLDVPVLTSRREIRDKVQARLEMLRRLDEDGAQDESRKEEARTVVIESGIQALVQLKLYELQQQQPYQSQEVTNVDVLLEEALEDSAIIAGGGKVHPIPFYRVSGGPQAWQQATEGYYSKVGNELRNSRYVNRDNDQPWEANLFAVDDRKSQTVIWMLHKDSKFYKEEEG